MVTFVPYFVNPVAVAWSAQAKSEARAAGLDPRDLAAMDAFYAARPTPVPQATVDDVVAHLEHAREVVGIDHLGLGGDYDGVVDVPVGLEDVSRYPVLLDALRERGWSDDDLARLAHGNVSRVLHDAEAVAVDLRQERGPSTATIADLDGPAAAAGDLG